MSAPNLLPIAAVAARLNCATKTVCQYASRGTLIGVKVGNRWKFDPREVDRFIARQTQRPAPRMPEPPVTVGRRIPRHSREPELQMPGADRFL